MAENPERIGDAIPRWLQAAIDAPPPPLDPEHLEREAQRERAYEARALLERLPEAVGRSRYQQLLDRIGDATLRAEVENWHPAHGNLLVLGPSAIDGPYRADVRRPSRSRTPCPISWPMTDRLLNLGSYTMVGRPSRVRV
jgi:hypothetical protein